MKKSRFIFTMLIVSLVTMFSFSCCEPDEPPVPTAELRVYVYDFTGTATFSYGGESFVFDTAKPDDTRKEGNATLYESFYDVPVNVTVIFSSEDFQTSDIEGDSFKMPEGGKSVKLDQKTQTRR
jgi:hypothetical protein